MKAFIVSLAVLVVISAGAAVALEQMGHSTAAVSQSPNNSTRL